MKYILLLLISLPCLAQKQPLTVNDLPYPIDSTTNKVSYVGVIQVPGVTPDQLYTRAKAYLFKAFNNASAVIQVDDKAGGLLGGKGILHVVKNPSAFVTASLDILIPIELRFKDGRFRYEITNLMSVYPAPLNQTPFDGDTYYNIRNTKPGKRYNQSQIDFANQINGVITNFINNLSKALKQPSGKEDF